MNTKRLLMILFFGIVLSSFAYATDLTNCTTISSSGEYNLINSLVDILNTSCFIIKSDDVTFDCQNYFIDGDSTNSMRSFNISDSKNVTVKNCNLTNWNMGIYSNNTRESLFSNIIISEGISDKNGMIVYYSSNNTFENINITSCIDGIKIYTNSDNNTLKNIYADSLTNDGIIIADSDSTKLYNINISNSRNGLRSSGGTAYYGEIINFTSIFNTKGISITNYAWQNFTITNFVSKSDSYGLDLQGHNIQIFNALIDSASDKGVLIPSSKNITLDFITINNSATAFAMTGSITGVILNNSIIANSSTAISATTGSKINISHTSFYNNKVNFTGADNITALNNISIDSYPFDNDYYLLQTSNAVDAGNKNAINATSPDGSVNLSNYYTGKNKDTGIADIGYHHYSPVNHVPTISITSPADDDHNNVNISAVYTPDDADSDTLTCYLYVNKTVNQTDTTITLGSSNTIVSNISSDGVYFWYINCTDGIDYANTSSRTYTLDTVNPIITIHSPTNKTYHNSNFWINVSATDSHLYILNYTFYNSSNSSIQSNQTNTTAETYLDLNDTIDVSKLGNGTYYINFSVSDQHTGKDISNLKKGKKGEEEFLINDTDLGIEYSMSVYFVEKDDKLTDTPGDLKSYLEFNNDDTKINFGINFTVLKPETKLIFRAKTKGTNIKIINSDYKGHLIWYPYGVDFEGNLYVNGIEKDYDVVVTKINNYEVEVKIIPSENLNGNDIVEFKSESIFGLNIVEKQYKIYIDKIAPDILITSVSPSSITTGSTVTIYANVTDVSNSISSVTFEIEDPNNDKSNISATLSNGTNSADEITEWSKVYTPASIIGTWYVKVYVDDALGNMVNTSDRNISFTVSEAVSAPPGGGGGAAAVILELICETDEECKKYGETYVCVQGYCLEFEPTCNFNGICEPERGETVFNCGDEYVNETLVISGDCHFVPRDILKMALSSQYFLWVMLILFVVLIIVLNAMKEDSFIKKQYRGGLRKLKKYLRR